MADFINKADFIENLSEYDKTALDDLKNIYKNIEDQKNTLETQQDSLLDLKDELKKKQTELQEKAKATSTNLTEVQAKLEKAKAEEAARLEAERLEQLQQNGGYDDTITNNGGQIDASADDVTLLAAILQCEAHQNYDSLLAVATVILNRVESPRFPNTIRGVIYASGQFEPVWTGRLDCCSEERSDLFIYAGCARCDQRRKTCGSGRLLLFPLCRIYKPTGSQHRK